MKHHGTSARPFSRGAFLFWKEGHMTEKGSVLFSKPAALVLGAVLGAAGLGIAHTKQKAGKNTPATLKMADRNKGASKSSFAPVVKAVLPSVVNISSSKVVKGMPEMGAQLDPFFRQFFG